jgi:tripartite-type tricarboxylate transporter receptor subunit TctC
MKLPHRRQFLHLAAGAAALPALPRVVRAQAYPTRPVRIVVGFAAGGGIDIIARLMGQWLSERLGQSFLIENRPGGGSNIATEAVVRAAPDGYTLLLAFSSNAINATLYEKLNFIFIRDIAPVAGVLRGPYVLVVNPSVPTKSVPEFIAYAKANPGKISMASGGIGTPGHVAGELFKMMAGVDLVHVPYRGGGPVLTDLLGGQVQVTFVATVSSIEYIRAGRLRALAVTAATRSEVLPHGGPPKARGLTAKTRTERSSMLPRCASSDTVREIKYQILQLSASRIPKQRGAELDLCAPFPFLACPRTRKGSQPER